MLPPLFPPRTALAAATYPTLTGLDWSGAIVRSRGLAILVCAVYLTNSLGLVGENLQKLRQLADVITALGYPFLLGGDWNIEPSTLAESPWLRAINGAVHTSALEFTYITAQSKSQMYPSIPPRAEGLQIPNLL